MHISRFHTAGPAYYSFWFSNFQLFLKFWNRESQYNQSRSKNLVPVFSGNHSAYSQKDGQPDLTCCLVTYQVDLHTHRSLTIPVLVVPDVQDFWTAGDQWLPAKLSPEGTLLLKILNFYSISSTSMLHIWSILEL